MPVGDRQQLSRVAEQLPKFARPKRRCLAAVRDLSTALSVDVTAHHDPSGEIRCLQAPAGKSLFTDSARFGGDAVSLAKRFIAWDTIKLALGLLKTTLRLGPAKEFEHFTRIEFQQVAHVPGLEEPVPVRGGFVHVNVDKSGRIIHVNSTVRRGTKPVSCGKLISKDEAVAAAKVKLGAEACEVPLCRLVLSSHEGHMDLVYEVELHVCSPRAYRQFLVLANSGEVVNDEDKLIHMGKKEAADGIPAKSFPRIPDFVKDRPITDQVRNVLIDRAELPDPLVLANERYIMQVLVKGKWEVVRANAKGTFEFDPLSKDPVEVSKFAAVLTFFWLNTQDATFEKWGATKVPNPIPVFVDDPDVSNNAYFDPNAWEIHLGIGTGLALGGLIEQISFDPGVSCHENVHKRNAAEAPGKDLPGRQGRGAGEATADCFGDLLFDFWMRLKNSDVLNHELTLQDIIDDKAIIGKYTRPPEGLRTQRNTNQFPRDIVNEEHEDGLIIGGAFFDLLVAMARAPAADVETLLITYGKLYINGTRLLPAHRVLFTDYVTAFITADGMLTGGANKQRIIDAFAGHGIKLAGKTARRAPTGRRRRR
jgi:hypothetical protein